MNPFKNVDVNKPPKITVAIGLWISFPGRLPFNANGINAKAELNAVIKIGFKRSGNLVSRTHAIPFPLHANAYSG